MADTNGEYKNGDAILVSYQAAGIGTGLTIKMDVYDEGQAKDTPKCIAAMTEIGATGRYYASFTPDAVGHWIVLMYNGSDNSGQVIKEFSVSAHNIDAVGNAVDALVTTVGALGAGLTAIPAPSGMLKSSDLSGLATSAEIAVLTSPAMVG